MLDDMGETFMVDVHNASAGSAQLTSRSIWKTQAAGAAASSSAEPGAESVEGAKPLLSCSDIRILLEHFLPRRDVTTEEVMQQMEVRHRKRQAAIDSAYKNQENQSVVVLVG
jgi:hypothetical protein